MKLKTLKDIQEDLRGIYCDTFDEPVDATNIRQEAIKWAKFLISKADESTSSKTDSYMQGKLDVLQEFFNLTKEDLK